jgi:hypothetical protein
MTRPSACERPTTGAIIRAVFLGYLRRNTDSTKVAVYCSLCSTTRSGVPIGVRGEVRDERPTESKSYARLRVQPGEPLINGLQRTLQVIYSSIGAASRPLRVRRAEPEPPSDSVATALPHAAERACCARLQSPLRRLRSRADLLISPFSGSTVPMARTRRRRPPLQPRSASALTTPPRHRAASAALDSSIP